MPRAASGNARSQFSLKVAQSSIDALAETADHYDGVTSSEVARLWMGLGKQKWDSLTPAKRRELVNALPK